RPAAEDHPVNPARILSGELPDCRRRRGVGVHVKCQLSTHGKQPLSGESQTRSRQIDTAPLPSVYGRPFWHAVAASPATALTSRPACVRRPPAPPSRSFTTTTRGSARRRSSARRP